MEKVLKICDIATMEETSKPLSRIKVTGPMGLTDNELLSIILGGKAINDYQKLDLWHMTEEEMLSSGMKKSTINKIIAIHEYSKRLWRHQIHLKRFTDAPSIASYMEQEMRHLEQEELRLLGLDIKSRLLYETTLTIGTQNMSLVSTREILISALTKRAAGIILVHNHPSGDPYPSNEDITATNMVKSGCDAIGIHLLDHIIIGEQGYYSFKEKGML